VGYWDLKERSDGIGWGTSYRPGEKEINHALTAGARFHQEADLHEAYKAHEAGDDTLIDALVQKQLPEAADEDEVKHWKAELLELGAAGGASAAYTARKSVKNSGVHRIVKKIGPLDRLNEQYGLLPAYEHAYKRPMLQKADRAIWRMHHPLRDPFSPHVSPLEFNVTPELPSIRQRAGIDRRCRRKRALEHSFLRWLDH
jgi:hypothetical protein